MLLPTTEYRHVNHLDAASSVGVIMRLRQIDRLTISNRRTQADYVLPDSLADYDADRDKLSLNALAFAGMILVKHAHHLDAVKDIGVREILRTVGMPRAKQPESEC